MTHPQPSRTRALTCFLSATSSADTAVVQRALADLNVHVETADDIPAGSQFASAIVQTVMSADFVCVVLTSEPTSPAVIYEAGVAAGSRRPLLVVVAADAADRHMIDIMQASIVRYQPGAEVVLRENLDAYLRQVRPIAAELTVNWDILTGEAGRSVGAHSQVSGSALEQRVAARLAYAGALVRSSAAMGSHEADVVAIFPTLGDAFNPVIVEVKARKRGPDQRDINQLSGTLHEFQARLGIFVHVGSAPAQNILHGWAAILAISIIELESWSEREIIRRLTGLRNELVHGAR